ncbi:MAG: hypothetical protein Q9222_005641 [Ikaeria aurantiellina]
MAAFWDSWALWEKLCFVLGASIVAVLILGMIKLAYTHWRLRQYTALAKTRAAQKEEAIQRQPSTTRRMKGNDVPFGIRAIESGIEVDGVWISRSNTPASSVPASPALSANKESTAPPLVIPDRTSTASNMSRLEIPQPAHGHIRPNSGRSPNSNHSRVSGNPFERPLSSEQSASRASSLYSEHTPRGRPTYQPRRASHLRYSNSHMTENAEALASLEGRQLSSKTGSKSSQGSTEYDSYGQRASDDSWSGSSAENQRPRPGASQATNQPHYQPTSVNPIHPRYNHSDLDSLASHRKSHAAETGQLLPRVRVNDTAGEWRTVQEPIEHQNFLSTPQARARGDPFATPQTTPLMTPASDPTQGPPSFEEFVRSTSPQGQYYHGEDGIPLQPQPRNSQGSSYFGASPSHQPARSQANRQEVYGGKSSSFSEAV